MPGSDVKAPVLELYLTALDGNGVALARAGSFSEPLTVEVIGPKEKITSKKWVWGLIGGIAAAGLAVGLGVGLTVGRSDPNASASLTIIAPSK